jgi:hypothetical protein
MKWYISIFASTLVLTANSTFPVCPAVEVWQNEQGNYLYLIPDVHTDYIDGRVSKEQLEDTLWAAQYKKACVIVEDSSDYSGNNKKIQNIFQKYVCSDFVQYLAARQEKLEVDPQEAEGCMEIFPTNFTHLTCLVRACKSKGIACYNAEYRQPSDIYEFNIPEDEKISFADVIHEVNQNIAQIEDKKYREHYAQEFEKVKKLATQNNLAAYKECITIITKNMQGMLEERIWRQLHVWQDKKDIFICAGSAHIYALRAGLPKIEYKKILEIGNASVCHTLDNDTLDQQPLSEDEVRNLHLQVLDDALDLRQTFKEVFRHQQEKQEQIAWQKREQEALMRRITEQASEFCCEYQIRPRKRPGVADECEPASAPKREKESKEEKNG